MHRLQFTSEIIAIVNEQMRSAPQPSASICLNSVAVGLPDNFVNVRRTPHLLNSFAQRSYYANEQNWGSHIGKQRKLFKATSAV